MRRNIGIIGGGPGGLTLARILATRGMASTVFELDQHEQARPQGGSLDLHTESGLRALAEAGLSGEFAALARYDDQYDALYDHHGVLRYEVGDNADGGRPEIDRAQLRAILLASMPAGTVRWGSRVGAVEPLPDGLVRVGDETFDLVVGADGAWSRVRPLVSDARPKYTGVTFIELQIDDVDNRHPAIAKLVPRGKISAAGNSQGLIAQRSSGGHVRVYYMFREPEDWLERGGLDLSTPDRARASLKAKLAGWAPSLLTFIDECNDVITPRPLVALPVGHRWEHRRGVTLLGDAAHVMSPFSGEGVNMAMLDATELALALTGGDDWDRAVAAYEERMFVRAAEAAAGADEGLAFVSEHGLEHVIEHFESMLAQTQG